MPKLGGQDGDPLQLQPEDLLIGGLGDKDTGLRNSLGTPSIRPDARNKIVLSEPLIPTYTIFDNANRPDDLIFGVTAQRSVEVNQDLPLPPARQLRTGIDFPVRSGDAGPSVDATQAEIPMRTDKPFPQKRLRDEIGLRVGDLRIGTGDLFSQAGVVGPQMAFPSSIAGDTLPDSHEELRLALKRDPGLSQRMLSNRLPEPQSLTQQLAGGRARPSRFGDHYDQLPGSGLAGSSGGSARPPGRSGQ